MKHIYDIVSNFKNLKEYTEFMETLVEKKADGNEISRGMNKHDKSKTDKTKTFVSKEVKKNANGGASEKHYSQADASLEQLPPEPEAPPPPPLQPGQQTKIGNKMVDQDQVTPKTKEITLSGKKQKLNLKPRIQRNPKAPPM